MNSDGLVPEPSNDEDDSDRKEEDSRETESSHLFPVAEEGQHFFFSYWQENFQDGDGDDFANTQ